MSHFSAVRTNIRDAAILKEAISNLGYRLSPDGAVRGYNSIMAKADIAIQLDGSYDLGYSLHSDGCYHVFADFSMGRCSDGENGSIELTAVHNRIQQAYARLAAERWVAGNQKQLGSVNVRVH